MPISRGLVISLGTSVLGCTLLFLYFRNRMSVIERKVDVMFDLIQNHNQQQQPMGYEEEPQNIQFSVREKEVEVEDNEDSRIVISEDEASDDDDEDDAFDSDDSAEVSDNEEEDTVSLNLKNSQNIEISDIKTITLDGPENSGDTVEVDSLDEIDEIDEIDDDDEDNISADKQEDKADEDDDEDDIEDVQEDIVVKEIDYSGLKVSELKAIAKEKGLSGYRSLKKNALVNLLKGN